MTLNLANILTMARLVLLPFILILICLNYHWAAWAALTLYIVAAITDWLDGFVARRFNQTTDFGRFLDPIADKIFVACIMVMLVAMDRIYGLHVLAVLAILTRELAVSGLREYLGPKNIVIHVSQLAKWKTAIQFVATGLLLLGPINMYLSIAGLLCLWAAAILTVITGAQYMREGVKYFDK
jgi:cardiolipin synthase